MADCLRSEQCQRRLRSGATAGNFLIRNVFSPFVCTMGICLVAGIISNGLRNVLPQFISHFGFSPFTAAVFWSLSAFISFSVIWSYLLAITTSAGTIPQNRLAPGQLMPIGFTWCFICGNQKPPRAHHCSLCGKCVPRMDHHCPFVANCVGEGNYHHFLKFLFWVTVGVTYAMGVSMVVIHNEWNPPSNTWLGRFQYGSDALAQPILQYFEPAPLSVIAFRTPSMNSSDRRPQRMSQQELEMRDSVVQESRRKADVYRKHLARVGSAILETTMCIAVLLAVGTLCYGHVVLVSSGLTTIEASLAGQVTRQELTVLASARDRNEASSAAPLVILGPLPLPAAPPLHSSSDVAIQMDDGKGDAATSALPPPIQAPAPATGMVLWTGADLWWEGGLKRNLHAVYGLPLSSASLSAPRATDSMGWLTYCWIRLLILIRWRSWPWWCQLLLPVTPMNYAQTSAVLARQRKLKHTA